MLNGLMSVAHMGTMSFAICDFTDEGTATVDTSLKPGISVIFLVANDSLLEQCCRCPLTLLVPSLARHFSTVMQLQHLTNGTCEPSTVATTKDAYTLLFPP